MNEFLRLGTTGGISKKKGTSSYQLLISQAHSKNGKDSGYCSTPDQQVRLASHMIAHQRVYRIVSQLSREHQISRQSLYTLRAKGRKDMESVFCLEEQQTGWEVRIARAVLTLFAQGHASDEGI